MNIATLRSEGSEAKLNTLREVLNLDIDADWKKGEARRRGGVYKNSGFNSTIADADNAVLLVIDIRKFLNKCKDIDVTFSSSEHLTQLDIGISVGTSEQYAPSITFQQEDLKLISILGLELCISSYPASFDDDE